MFAFRPSVPRASFALLLALGFAVDASPAFAQTSQSRAAASANKSAPKNAVKVAQAPSAQPAPPPKTAPVADAPKLSPAEEAKYQEALQRFNSQDLAEPSRRFKNSPPRIPPRRRPV